MIAAKAVLLDLDGTLYHDERLLPGAAETLEALRRAGIPYAFVTNTTSKSRAALGERLARLGLDADPARLFTPAAAARQYLISRGHTRCHFLLAHGVLPDFEGIEPVDASPHAVVVGDLSEDPAFRYGRLNRALHHLLDGSELVTLALNRYFLGSEGYVLDVGAIVAGLEYASGRKATLLGKPAPEFFGAALASLGVPSSEAICVGDDLESDVLGAQDAGMRGVLVRTGKFREEVLARAPTPPDAVIGSIADLPSLLGIGPAG
jgi:HAD superfamily hydrolase (TIGR01458 family)